MEDLTFKEPITFNLTDYDDKGKKVEKTFEIIPLDVDDMKMTVQFSELQKELTNIQLEEETKRIEKNKKELKKQKGRKTKKDKPEVQQQPTVINPDGVERSQREEEFIINRVLPLLVQIVEKGLVDFKTQEPTMLPRRYRTLPKLMQIAIEIVNVTTETSTPVNVDFRMEEPPNKD